MSKRVKQIHFVPSALADGSGCPRNEVVRTLLNTAMKEFGSKHGIPYAYTYCDDAIVYLCRELAIDISNFPHNTPKLPIDGFIEYAHRRSPGFVLAANEIQWTVQRKRLASLFNDWRASVCKWDDCNSYHHECGERYVRPPYWEIAKQIRTSEKTKVAKPGLKLVCADGVRVRG